MGEVSPQHGEDSGSDNFYQGMIIASIIAAVGLLALIIVTALYLKRTTTYKAIISGGKKSEFAFNNKAFTGVSIRFLNLNCTLTDLILLFYEIGK